MTYGEFPNWHRNYYDKKQGRYMRERLGQAFCNDNGIHDSELFYVEDVGTAIEIITSKYLGD